MENVDEIILHQLRSIGIEVGEEMQQLRDLSTDAVFKSISECLRIISGQSDLPKSLPPSMSLRYNHCGKLADMIKSLGYRGDIGYQTILYCSETDIRNVLAFLIEKLPKEQIEVQATKLTFQDNVLKMVFTELASQLNRSWIPPRYSALVEQGTTDFDTAALKSAPLFDGEAHNSKSCNSTASIWTQAGGSSSVLSTSVIDYLALVKSLENRGRWEKPDSSERTSIHYKSDISEAVKAAALLSHIAGKSGKGGVPPKPTPRKSNAASEKTQSTAEEEERLRKEQADNLRSELLRLKEELNSLLTEVTNIGRRKGELEREVDSLVNDIDRCQKSLESRELVTSLLPNAAENVEKLQAAIQSRRSKIEQLRSQWLELKASLQSKLDKLTGGAELAERQELEKRLASAEEGREMVINEIAIKEDIIKALEAELEKAPKDVSRSVYTKRIIDMIGNTKKQKNEIQKIAADTRAVQKEMNSLNEKVDRAFHIADEMVFRDSKRDESARKMYRLLAAMHQDFTATVVAVDDAGSLNRELDDTETQVESEARKGWEERANKIAADLHAMRQDAVYGSH